jgi:hypothetical protein
MDETIEFAPALIFRKKSSLMKMIGSSVPANE